MMVFLRVKMNLCWVFVISIGDELDFFLFVIATYLAYIFYCL
jgi:hypothetical protein